MIRVYANDPLYPLDQTVASLKEAHRLIACYKQLHPEIEVFWHPVHKA